MTTQHQHLLCVHNMNNIPPSHNREYQSSKPSIIANRYTTNKSYNQRIYQYAVTPHQNDIQTRKIIMWRQHKDTKIFKPSMTPETKTVSPHTVQYGLISYTKARTNKTMVVQYLVQLCPYWSMSTTRHRKEQKPHQLLRVPTTPCRN